MYYIYIYIYIYNSLIADSSDKGSHRGQEKQHRVKSYPPDTLHGRIQRENIGAQKLRTK